RRAAILVGESLYARIPVVLSYNVAERVDRADSGLRLKQSQTVLRHDQRDRPVRGDELLHQSHCVGCSRRARYSHHNRRSAAHLSNRSVNTNPRNTMLMTPFIVKNAASRREKSLALTSECSYKRRSPATTTPAK